MYIISSRDNKIFRLKVHLNCINCEETFHKLEQKLTSNEVDAQGIDSKINYMLDVSFLESLDTVTISNIPKLYETCISIKMCRTLSFISSDF